MTKRLAAAALVTLTLGVAACADDYLTEVPLDFIGPDNFFRNADDAIAAVNGVYASFIYPEGYGVDDYFGRNLYMLVEYPGESLTSRFAATHERGGLDAFNYTVEHPYLPTVWGGAYSAIASANSVIGNVPNIDMDAALRSRLVAEARFLRAIHYFTLARLFGDVPLRLEEVRTLDNLELPRAPAAEVYAAIIEDLEFAEANLPINYTVGADSGRATRGAAQALLAKVHLQYGAVHGGGATSFNAAAAAARNVIQGGQYSLLQNYEQIFALGSEMNAEVIFAIQNTRVSGVGGRLAQHVAPQGSGLSGANNPGISFYLEWPFYRDWSDEDLRKDGTALTTYQRPNNGPVVTWSRTMTAAQQTAFGSPGGGPGLKKYIDPTALAAGGEEPDYILLRYSDVLLMLAEAINEASGPTVEAYDALNEVRDRAGLLPLDGLTQAQFRDAVHIERRYEFILEGHTFFDMQRHWEWSKARVEANMLAGRPVAQGGEGLNASPWGNSAPKIGIADGTVEDRRRFFPIPVAAMASNSQLVQTPGW